eukprot:CAMPEP_0168333044 /NCGR_PEP_ID=MMETSP0213-20121227/9349_1 /TAXON_ID=151035 /ORGANISM="Euplotes harpa, Strain FSP1.4" /LENGTH=113 /DNA_ID=CAMNT_0008337245 /DNA_START=435 /DNA_END=777 /DNA_ORIENTATION=+
MMQELNLLAYQMGLGSPDLFDWNCNKSSEEKEELYLRLLEGYKYETVKYYDYDREKEIVFYNASIKTETKNSRSLGTCSIMYACMKESSPLFVNGAAKDLLKKEILKNTQDSI